MIDPFSATLSRGIGLSLPALPYWQGVRTHSVKPCAMNFSLGVDQSGFVRQVSDASVIETTVAAYQSAQYGFITAPPGTTAWGTRLGEQKLATLESMLGSLDGMRVLEIGGATLYLAGVACARYRIPRYVCVDPALRRGADDPASVELVQSYFPADEIRGEKFDLVIANSCLEHVAELRDFLRGIYQALSDDGVVYCTFPDVDRCFRDGDLNALLHEHINYLNEATARALFSSFGLTVVRWSSSNDLASCLLRKGDISVQQRFSVQATHLFATLLDGIATRLIPAADEVLADMSRSPRLAFYGANNGLNTFLAWAGPDVARAATIIDGDVAKKGKFLPACPNPIVWSGDADFGALDRIVIAAASFQDEIVSALVGKFAVPASGISGLFKPIGKE